MNIIVFGASGKVGQVLVSQLLKQNHRVTAFVHNNDPFKSLSTVQVIHGDIHDNRAVDKAIENADAVMSTLGSWGTSSKDIVSSGMKSILTAMKSHNVTRIITLTGTEVRADSDKPTLLQKLTHAAFKRIASSIISDGEKHIRLLQDSSLTWTVIRSPGMRSRGSFGKYTVSLVPPMPWKTAHRHDVAAAMIDQLSTDTYHNAAPYITS